MKSLEALAQDGLTRLKDRPPLQPGARPQLLAAQEGSALVRTAQGVKDMDLSATSAPFDLSLLMDHTLLRAEATPDRVTQHCQEALAFGFASVCVNPVWVPLAADLLRGSLVRVGTVNGFPLGALSSSQKAREAELSLALGAQEIDTVLPIGRVLGGDWPGVAAELQLLREVVPKGEICLKVILETCLLNEAQKTRACLVAFEAGVDFVKTSTGFGSAGATVADVQLLRTTVGASCGVKASGGIRTYNQALAMVLAGATRLGISASVAVMEGTSAPSSGY